MDRAAILKVGACDQMPGGAWIARSWDFDLRNYRGLVFHVGGIAGWTFPELAAVSDAEMELAMLPVRA